MTQLSHAPTKVLDLAGLVTEVERRKRLGHRITLLHGMFDTDSHLDRALLKALRPSADVVVATIADNPHDPRASQAGRALDLARRTAQTAGIGEIDLVAVVPWSGAERTIAALAPDVYAFPTSGDPDRDAGPTPGELAALARSGTELYTLSRRGDAVVEWRQRLAPQAVECRAFLDRLAARTPLPEVLEAIEGLGHLRVAVVGETIIDEYAYCDAIGKSGKEPMIVNRFVRCDAQAGGVLAVANHAAEFCREVRLVSALGSVDSREAFVRSNLHPKIRARFATKQGSPTIVKRRYLDLYSQAKMMGVYHMDSAPLGAEDEASFLTHLEDALDGADVVIVADYGHGLIGSRAVRLLMERSKFLAVNAQLNAANTGYHVLSKYDRVDYACQHEGEIRLDARDLYTELDTLLAQAAHRLGARAVMATQGRQGTSLFTREGGISHCPAFASMVVERIGAGDAVLAISSLAVAAGLPPELTGFLGNLAGAQMVQVVGNSASIRKSRLIEAVRHLLEGASSDPGAAASEARAG